MTIATWRPVCRGSVVDERRDDLGRPRAAVFPAECQPGQKRQWIATVYCSFEESPLHDSSAAARQWADEALARLAAKHGAAHE